MILPLLLFLAAGASIQYWVEPCKAGVGCEPDDVELATWSLVAWEKASGGALRIARIPEPEHAQIRLYWNAPEGLYGEARPIVVDGKPGAEVYVRTATPPGDPLLRTTIVYLTCLHETGHALGLGHTADFGDIMYSFYFGGDIGEYFGRYRRKLKVRDDIRDHSGISSADRQALIDVLSARFRQ